ncbi:hypothetical protein EBR03_05415, partial [bacterium]|nr:hypothetical protein [bacterium]
PDYRMSIMLNTMVMVLFPRNIVREKHNFKNLLSIIMHNSKDTQTVILGTNRAQIKRISTGWIVKTILKKDQELGVENQWSRQ